jgi:REP element-mobilizing transposase RayT
MWNDTDVPLAYFISFRSYGTWLHGDDSGSIDRHNNKYGTPKIPANPHWHSISEARLRHKPFTLDAGSRGSVYRAIKETCEKRNWQLLAINIRTNHVHTVVANSGIKSETILIAFKANSTRHLREDGRWVYEHSPWAEKGSRRRLWNKQSISNAVKYVVNGQGDDLPTFE